MVYIIFAVVLMILFFLAPYAIKGIINLLDEEI